MANIVVLAIIILFLLGLSVQVGGAFLLALPLAGLVWLYLAIDQSDDTD